MFNVYLIGKGLPDLQIYDFGCVWPVQGVLVIKC